MASTAVMSKCMATTVPCAPIRVFAYAADPLLRRHVTRTPPRLPASPLWLTLNGWPSANNAFRTIRQTYGALLMNGPLPYPARSGEMMLAIASAADPWSPALGQLALCIFELSSIYLIAPQVEHTDSRAANPLSAGCTAATAHAQPRTAASARSASMSQPSQHPQA